MKTTTATNANLAGSCCDVGRGDTDVATAIDHGGDVCGACLFAAGLAPRKGKYKPTTGERLRSLTDEELGEYSAGANAGLAAASMLADYDSLYQAAYKVAAIFRSEVARRTRDCNGNQAALDALNAALYEAS